LLPFDFTIRVGPRLEKEKEKRGVIERGEKAEVRLKHQRDELLGGKTPHTIGPCSSTVEPIDKFHNKPHDAQTGQFCNGQ